MPISISISCKTISLFLLIFHTCANELNIFEPGTQVDTILSQDNNLAVSAGSTTATFEGITDDALQQHDQHPSDPNPLLLASKNPNCAASSSNTIQSPAGRRRRRSRMRSKRDGGGNGGDACEWQDGPGTTTTPDDQQIRGKKRRPKPGYISPAIGPGLLGPLNNPEPFTKLRPAPYKLDREPDPQKCPFGQQNIPVCYPKVAPTPINPALVLSPCRTGELYISLSSLYELQDLFRLCSSDWGYHCFCFQAASQQMPFLKKREKKNKIIV